MDAIEVIKNKVKLIDVMEYYNFNKITNHGSEYRACCKIHNGNNPTAFIANKSNNLYYCHTANCGGGDIFDLVMALENISFIEAVKHITNIFSIDIAGMTIKQRKNNSLKETLEWIEKMRSLKHKTIQSEYDINELGELFSINKYRQFNKDLLNYFNVRYSKHLNRIVIPIYQNNICVGVTMRTTNNSIPKWKHNPKGIKTSNLLYNLDKAKQFDSIILTEGCFDAWNFHSNNFYNAVSTFGCNLSDQQVKTLLISTYSIIIAYDNDTAGIEGTRNAIDKLQNKVNLKIANIPIGKDPGELCKEEIEEAIKNSHTIKQWRDIYG